MSSFIQISCTAALLALATGKACEAPPSQEKAIAECVAIAYERHGIPKHVTVWGAQSYLWTPAEWEAFRGEVAACYAVEGHAYGE
jgi:hypothetical protein